MNGALFTLGLANKIKRGRAVGQYYVLCSASTGAIAHYFDTVADRAAFLAGKPAIEVDRAERIARERCS